MHADERGGVHTPPAHTAGAMHAVSVMPHACPSARSVGQTPVSCVLSRPHIRSDPRQSTHDEASVLTQPHVALGGANVSIVHVLELLLQK